MQPVHVLVFGLWHCLKYQSFGLLYFTLRYCSCHNISTYEEVIDLVIYLHLFIHKYIHTIHGETLAFHNLST